MQNVSNFNVFLNNTAQGDVLISQYGVARGPRLGLLIQRQLEWRYVNEWRIALPNGKHAYLTFVLIRFPFKTPRSVL